MRLNENDNSMDGRPNPTAYQLLQEELHNAIALAYRNLGRRLNTDDFAMLQGFALITEFTGLDGERRLDLMHSEDSRIWQIKSWLDHALTDLNAQQLALYLDRS